jgi:probable rRNA maturation factor
MVDADKMKSLNSTTRGIDKVTDVLSYPTLGGIRGAVLDTKNCNTALDGKYIMIGSIVLCEEKVKEQAKEFGHSEGRERTYLIVHGLLHLFGYDHMTDADKAQMRKKEKEVLALLGVVDE